MYTARSVLHRQDEICRKSSLVALGHETMSPGDLLGALSLLPLRSILLVELFSYDSCDGCIFFSVHPKSYLYMSRRFEVCAENRVKMIMYEWSDEHLLSFLKWWTWLKPNSVCADGSSVDGCSSVYSKLGSTSAIEWTNARSLSTYSCV